MSELVIVKDGKAICNSRMVAEKFGKRHTDVMRAIQNLECSKDFTERNFAHREYTDSTGRKFQMIEMTRDGFTFLAMGFTGREVAKWKEAYINAFNALESELRSTRTLTPMQILEQQLELMREQERQIQAVKHDQNLLANEIHEIKAKVTTTNSDFYSIAGYASLRGIRHLDILTAGRLTHSM